MVDDGLEVTDEVGELRAGGGIEVDLYRTLNDGGKSNIGESDTLGDKEGAGGEVRLKSLQRTDLTLLESGVDLTIEESQQLQTAHSRKDLRA